MEKIVSIVNDVNLTVSTVMLEKNSFPVIKKDAILKDAIEQMVFYKLGVVCVIGDSSDFVGLITDGDIRRMLLTVQKPLSALFMEDVVDHISTQPATIHPEMLISEATRLIGLKKVWDLPVLSKKNKLVGLFHLHKALEFYINIKK